MIHFPDRPIVTAGLGILFALILLGALSYPSALNLSMNNAQNSTPSYGPGVAVTSTTAQSAQYSVSSTVAPNSSSQSETTVVQSGTTFASTTEFGTTSVNANSTNSESSATTVIVPANTTSVVSESTLTQAESIVASASAGTITNMLSDLNRISLLALASLGVALVSTFVVRRRMNSKS